MDGYRLVFDVTHKFFHFETWMIGLAALPLVLLLVVLAPMRGANPYLGKLVAGGVISLVIVVLLVLLAGYFIKRNGLITAEKRGAYSVVEGCLEGFHAMPARGHDTERLLVGGQGFKYSDFMPTPGFNDTQTLGGPVHADSKVRIGYVGPDIIRLEVMDHACAEAPDAPRF